MDTRPRNTGRPTMLNKLPERRRRATGRRRVGRTPPTSCNPFAHRRIVVVGVGRWRGCVEDTTFTDAGPTIGVVGRGPEDFGKFTASARVK